MKVILTGGGTGGHFFPLIALARRLIEKGIEVLIVGRKHSWEEKYCLEYKLSFKGISTGKRKGKFSLQNVKAVIKLVKGIFGTFRIFRGFAPEVIVGFGGYVSMPVMSAGFLARYPLIIHEQNISPGLTTRLFAPVVKEIALSFPDSFACFSKRLKRKMFVAGCPLRPEAISAKSAVISRKSFGLEDNKFTLLVIGGSQGAQRLNHLVIEAQKIWQKENIPIQIIHLTGEKDYAFVKDAYKGIEVKAFVSPFWANIGELYSIADLALGRGGAVTLFELARWGIPSIIVPYPYASGRHQEVNALFFNRQGASKVVEEKNLTPGLLLSMVNSLLKDKKQLEQMAKASRKLGKNDSTDVLTERIIRLAGAVA